MSVQEAGRIRYFSSTHLNWHLSRYLDLLQKDSSRIWSPKFAYHEEKKEMAPSPPKWAEFVPDTTFLKICITSDNRTKGNLSCIRIGVTDERGYLMDLCNCVWNAVGESFDGMNLIRANELTRRQKGEVPGYLRLFCEIPKETCRKLVNIATQTNAENG